MKKLLGNFNWPLFASMLALIAIGALTIRSAGAVRSAAFHDMWLSTLQTSLFGLAVYLTLAFSDYRNYFSWFALPVYAFSLVLLVLVLLVQLQIFHQLLHRRILQILLLQIRIQILFRILYTFLRHLVLQRFVLLLPLAFSSYQ